MAKKSADATAKKTTKVTVEDKPQKATAKKVVTVEEPKKRGRKVGALGYRWIKSPKEPWPSALETCIMDAMQKVGEGTSGDVLVAAEKAGLADLTKQVHNKVVTHVLVKMLKAGIIARTDSKPKAKTKAPAKAKVVAKGSGTEKPKAKKARVVLS